MRLAIRCLLAVFVFALAVGFRTGPARADTLDDVLTVLSTAGVVDPAVVEAKPMIQCLLDGKSVEQCAKLAAGKAQGLVPNDPKIQKVVDVFHAVQAKDWLKVFFLAGEQVVCNLVPGGAVKDLFCGEVFKVAKPVIASAYAAVKSGDILKLVSLVGVGYACELLPDAPGASELCGVLGDIVNGVAEGVKSAVGALGNLAEDVAGQSQHMPVEEYYVKYWRPWLQYAVVKQLHTGQPHYLYAGNYASSSTSCVEYFDSHKMSESNAKKVCGIMKSRFLQEVAEAAKVFQAYPPAYFAGAAAARVPGWTAAYYQKIDGFAKQFAQPASWNGYALQSYLLSSGAPFKNLWSDCNAQKPMTLPPIPGPNQGVHNADKANMGTAISWACTRVGQLLAVALQQEKATIDGLAGKVAAVGCGKMVSTSPGIHFSCPTYDAYRACNAIYPGGASKTESLCWVDGYAAEPALAKQVVDLLGAKRCKTVSKSGYMGILDVECTRPWKRVKCQSLVAALSQGAPDPSIVACLLKEDSSFVTGKQQAQSIIKAMNTKATGMGYVDPKTGVKGGIAMVTAAGCQTAPEGMWDPLRITCKDPSAQKDLGAKLAGCPPDANQDGADAPCYAGPLSAATKPKATAGLAPDAGLAPGASPPAGRKTPTGTLPTVGGRSLPGAGGGPQRAAGAVTRIGPSPAPGGLVARAPAGVPATHPPIAVKGVEVEPSPFLVVASARPRVETACRAPMPVLTVAVHVKNTGSAPLPAGKGTTYVKEVGGTTNLSSAGIHLPGVAPGAVAVVSVPVITLSPYSALPGTHQLAVHLSPLAEGGQPSFGKPESPYRFVVTFPVGYCQTRGTPPASSGPAGVRPPGETRGLNPQPEPPSAPTGLVPRSP